MEANNKYTETQYNNGASYPSDDLPSVRESEEYSNQMGRLFKNDKKIRPITFQVTDKCNLCCTYCYQINKGIKRLSIETAKKFIDYLLDSTPETNSYINPENTNGIIIDFIGGEPFLEVELMDQICEYFINQMILKGHPWLDAYKISVGSNGTLYFNENVQKFVKKYKDNLSITITIDGNKELHDSCRIFPDGSGSYDLAVAAAMDYMHNINNSSITNTKLTIAPENVEYFYGAIVNLIELGYTSIHANCVFEEGWTVEHAKVYYQQLKKVADYIIDNGLFNKVKLALFDINKYRPLPEEDNQNWCGGDGQMLAINPDGYIYNCVRYMESSVGSDVPPLRIGDVENGISSCDSYKCNLKCMQCINRRSQSTDKCFYCPIATGCGWCSAYNYQKFGTPDKRATFRCDMHKAESLANTYYFNKYAEKKTKEGNLKYATNRLPIYCPYDWAVDIISEEEYNLLVELSHENRRKVRV